MDSKAQEQEAKQEARKARNEAQAQEETTIWQGIEANASKAREIVRRKPKVHYSDELAMDICEQLANGVSLQRISQQ